MHGVCVNLGEMIDLEVLHNTSDKFNIHLKIVDAQDLFVESSVRFALKSHAKYLSSYPISSSLSRPIMAKIAIDYAKEIGAVAILHTANQSQNSLRRLNQSIEMLEFKGFYGSPYEYSALSRKEKAETLTSVGLSFYAERSLSGDANLWCREFESGELDNPESFEMPESAFTWTRHLPEVKPKNIKIEFYKGEIKALDGVDVSLRQSIEILNWDVGQFGHGRFVGLEHLEAGEKVLEVREAPAAMILMDALRLLETATLDAATISFKQHLEQAWTNEAIEGRWFSQLKAASQSAIEQLNKNISGKVTFQVNHQSCLPISIISSKPLYLVDRDKWELEAALVRSARGIRDYELIEQNFLNKKINWKAA